MGRSASAARAPGLPLLLALVLLGLLGTGARADDETPSGGGLDADAASEVPPSGPLPDVRWYTLDTPHFHIHFYADERPLADHTAIIAERAFILLTRNLNWRPSGRINITLNDHTDFANGFASSVPQNFVFGFGAPPGPFDELGDFDDYLKLLITHELTHVVHLDTILGFARIYNAVFGKLYSPNLSQANWWVEGLAVVQESRQTVAGRLRSAIFDMELRAPFLEGHVLGLDTVSHGPLVFPQGTAAYLYGSSILKYVEDRYGPEKLTEISHRYGRSLIPGAMNRMTARAVGKPYAGIFAPGLIDEWRASMSHRYALQSEEARRRGPIDDRRVTYEAPGPRSDGLTPRFFPDGTVLYHRATVDDDPAYVRLDLETGAKQVLALAYGAGLATPTPDGRALVFQRLSLIPLRWRISGNANLSWTDLYRLDLETGELRELTRVRRAAEPDVSPDGTRIACIVGGTGTRQLAVLALNGNGSAGAPKVLAADVPGLAYSPAWSPDGRFIAYSRWKDGGFRDIHVYDVAAGTDRALAVDRALDVDPRFSPDGRYLIFSSDRTGIYNVFARELATGRLYQVTNVLGGAFQPAVSPDGRRLVYMGFTSAGYDLFTAPFDPWTWPLAQPYVNARPQPTLNPGSLADSPDAKPGEGSVTGFPESIGPYRPWQYMYPRTWIVDVVTNPLGLGNSAQVQFTVGDPAANHAVGFQALIPSDLDASLRLDYAYSRLWPSFGFTATRSAGLANDLIIDGARVNYRQHASSASVSMGLPVLRRPISSADVSFGYTFAAYAPADPLPVADPTRGITIPPEHGPDANLFLTWSFSNVRSWAYSISGQKGRRLQLSLTVSNQSLGGRFSTTRASWYWTEYFTPPWARFHAFALLYSGGLQAGDKAFAFGLGGYVEQDLIRNLFLNRRQCCTYQRGYLPNSAVGDQYHLVSAEYRMPLLWIERGYETFPIYLRRLNGAVFTDIGNAFYGNFRFQDLRYAAGVELRLSLSLFYWIETEIQLGLARGFSNGGGNQVYFVTTFPF
jgi:Tol biopolymer transport system component